MSAAQDADGEVTNRLSELENAVNQVRSASELPEKKRLEREARKVWNSCKQAANALRREANALSDVTQKSVFTRKHTQHMEKINAYDREMRNLLRPVAKRQMTAEDKAMTNILGDAGDMTDAGKVMQAAVRAQDDNLDILRRVEATAVTIEETGNEITVRLAQDTEKIREIDKELNTLQANIDRAKGEVEWFARQMATDKCFLFLMVFVILGLCVLVGYKIFKNRKDKSNATDAPTTLSPDTIAPTPVPATLAPPTSTTIMSTTTATTTTSAATTTIAPTTTTSAGSAGTTSGPTTTVAAELITAKVLHAVLTFALSD